MNKFSSPAADVFSDFTRAYENKRGEKLTGNAPYLINIVFKNHICVSNVLVQQNAPGQQPSNVAKIEVSYKVNDTTPLTTADGQPIVLQSADNEPIVRENQIRCGIHGIDVQILKLAYGDKPSNVRLIVMGCFEPSKQTWLMFIKK